MVIPIRKQMDDLDEKIAEMEQSITLIAKFVKKETDSAKGKDLGELKAYAEKITSLENSIKEIAGRLKGELNSLRNEIKENSMKQLVEMKKMQPDTMKVVELEKRFNAELGRLQGFISGSNKAFSDYVEKKITDELARLEAVPNKHLNDREMEDYMERMAKVKGSMERFVNMKTQLLESRINELGQLMKHLRLEIRDSNPAEIDTKFSGIEQKILVQERKLEDIDEIKRNIERLGKRVQEIHLSQGTLTGKMEDSHLHNQGQIKNELSREIEDIRGEVDDLRKSVAAISQDTKSYDIGELQRKLQEDMKKIALQINYRIDSREGNNTQEGKDKGHHLNLHMSPHSHSYESPAFSEKEINELKNEISEIRKSLDNENAGRLSLDRHVSEIDKKINERHGDSREIQDLYRQIESLKRSDRLDEIYSKIENDMKKMKMEINHKNNGKTPSNYDNFEIESIRKELDEVRQDIDNENANRMSLEKNMNEMHSLIQKVNAKNEVDDIRESIEKETINRMSMEKSLADMEKAITEMKEKYGSIMKFQNFDFEGLQKEIADFRENINNSHRDVHLKTMELITKQMHEFAKTIDKKVPDLVTKDEFEASLMEIKAKMQNVQAPDLRPLARRIEELEKNLMGIMAMMKSVYHRSPIVLE